MGLQDASVTQIVQTADPRHALDQALEAVLARFNSDLPSVSAIDLRPWFSDSLRIRTGTSEYVNPSPAWEVTITMEWSDDA